MRVKLLLLALCALLLAGCQRNEAPVPPVKTAQELLEEQPFDEDHDAFLVDTGGRLGTLLVTVEWENKDHFQEPEEDNTTLSVWDPKDMTAPLQTMTMKSWGRSLLGDCGDPYIVDADFNGYSDLTYTSVSWASGSSSYLWLWDEEKGQFMEEPVFCKISNPRIDPEKEIVYGWNSYTLAGDGEDTFYLWENGRLICVRRIEAICYWGDPTTLSVEELVDGELKEVYYEEFPWDSTEKEGNERWSLERGKWMDLNYHGETESN